MKITNKKIMINLFRGSNQEWHSRNVICQHYKNKVCELFCGDTCKFCSSCYTPCHNNIIYLVKLCSIAKINRVGLFHMRMEID